MKNTTVSLNKLAVALQAGLAKDRTPMGLAFVVDGAGWVSPDEAAKLRARVAELEALVGDGSTRTADEDPIAYSLTPAVEALHASSGAVIETPSRREQSTAKLRGILARQRASLEDPHDSPLHHDYRTPRELPEAQR